MPEILIIEDSDNDAALLARALRGAGVTNPIQRAANGAEATALLHRHQHAAADERFAVVFIDLRLPHANGFEILTLLQGLTGFEKTLRVVVSSVDDMESIKTAYLLGADSFIAKPAHHLDVNELIRSFPDHWQLLDAAHPASTTPAVAETAASGPSLVWAENRALIQKVRETLETLHRTVNDCDETFAIIEALTEELRNKSRSDAARV